MSLLVTGSIGIDTVKTPFGVSKDCLGGSAVYFSMAASFFSPVRFLGAIGADCPFDLKKIFKGRKVDLNGLELRHKSKTFRWAGSYQGAMNEAITDSVELNVLAENPPQMPEEYKDSKFVFLANTAPILQIQLLDQLNKPKFVAADTMNLWINNNLADLKRLLKKIDCLILNETEARMLANEHNLITAAAKIEKLGPSVVVIKKGESGSIIRQTDGAFICPARLSRHYCQRPHRRGRQLRGRLYGLSGGPKQDRFRDFEKGRRLWHSRRVFHNLRFLAQRPDKNNKTQYRQPTE